MIPKTPEDLNSYIRDGGDPDRISIGQDPVPVKPSKGLGNGNEIEGNHNYMIRQEAKWTSYYRYLWKT